MDKELHPNIIIRRHIRSKAKIGNLLLQIYSEKIKWETPERMEFYKKLKSNWIDIRSWNKYLYSITEKEGKFIKIVLSDSTIDIIEWFVNAFDIYAKMSKAEKELAEVVLTALYYNSTKKKWIL